MSKTIVVAIGENGKMAVDFSGFEGEGCFDEAEKLERLLREMGIETAVEARKRKAPKIPQREGGHTGSPQQNDRVKNKGRG